MDTAQNYTQSPTPPQAQTDSVKPPELLKYLQNEYITFCASSGISMTEDGNFVAMTVTQFAAAAGVSRRTLYNWQKSIPNFWQRVDERAREIFNQSTKYAIFKGLKLKAMAGDTKAAEMVMSHYSDYTPPAQKHEVKLSGWGDMVREARKRAIKSNRPVVEAEVVPSSTDSQKTLSTEPPIESPSQPARPEPIPPPAPQPEPASPQIPTPNPQQPPVGPINTNQPIII